MKNCTPLWREADFEVKMYKTHQCRTTFWRLRCRKSARRCGAKHISKSKCTKHTRFRPLLAVEMSKKWHAVVARSTFGSQHVQNTPASDHFWKLRCRKSARRCGAKHISKSKCTKHHMFAPLLEVRMLKKCTPLYKTPHVRATFGGSDVEKVHAVVARSTFPSQNVQNTTCSRHFWRFGCRKSARRCGAKHISKVKMHKTPHVRATFGGSDVEKVHAVVARSTFPLHYTALQYITLHNTTTTTTQLHSTTLHYTPLHSTTLNYTTLHYITLQLQLHNYTPLQYTPPHSTTLNYSTLHYITLHYTPLHYTTLHYTTFHYTSLHYTYTTLHYTTTTTTATQLHSTTLHYTKLPLHYITLHYTTFHYTPLHYTT